MKNMKGGKGKKKKREKKMEKEMKRKTEESREEGEEKNKCERMKGKERGIQVERKSCRAQREDPYK